MSAVHLVGRLFGASAILLAGVAACGAAAPVSQGARSAWTPDLSGEDEARHSPHAEKPPADGGTDSTGDAIVPDCPYGSLQDPHRGFVRCLTAQERDAGAVPPPGLMPGPPEPAPAAPPVVEVGTPTFENGDVPRVEKALNKSTTDIATCVASHGGLTGETSSLKVQFLVRSRGRAEGVEVVAAKGVNAEAAACVRKLLKNKAIGAPTADPVGVSVVVSLKAAK